MKFSRIAALLLAVAASTGPGSANAATVNFLATSIDASGFGCSGSVATVGGCTENESVTIPGSGETITVLSVASGNSDTGVIRASTTASADGFLAESFLKPSASASIVERFTLNGTAIFGMAFDGSWDVFNLSGEGAGVNISNGLFIRRVGQSTVESTNLFEPPSTLTTGSVDDTISLGFFSPVPIEIEVTWLISFSIFQGQGTIDFGSTGLLFTEVLAGSTLTPSDPNFLSASPLSSVPLPSTFLLAMSAFAGLAAMRAFSRRKPVCV